MQWDLISLFTGLLTYYFFIICTIYVHEGGHWLTAKIFGFHVTGFRVHKFFYIIPVPTAVNHQIPCGEFKNFKHFNIKYLSVLINGIIAGTIPIIYAYIEGLYSVSIAIGLLYIYGCKSDIKQIIKMYKGEPMWEEETVTIHIPENEAECISIHPNCDMCAYHMVSECDGNKEIFPDKYKPTDLNRLKKIVMAKFPDATEEI
jgi:hypothetical protein